MAAKGILHQEEAFSTDQRVLYPLYKRGFVRMLSGFRFSLTPEGVAAMDAYGSSEYWRKNPKAPVAKAFRAAVPRRPPASERPRSQGVRHAG